MTAPTNLSFEAGSAGVATAWTLAATSTYEELADYNTTGEPWERFEREWDSNEDYEFAFVGGDLGGAVYGTVLVDFVKTVENFEELWLSNQSYLRSLDSPEPEAALYESGTLPKEAFEVGWDNDAYLTAFVGVGTDLTAGDFDGFGGPEGFEASGWSPGYISAFVGIGTDLSSALYNGAGVAFEVFLSEQAPRQFSVVLSTDILTLSPSNPFSNANLVFVTADGSFPSPLQATQAYYVRDLSGLTMKLALTIGGTAIDITTAPNGPVYLTGDPVYYWTEKMVTTAF